MPNHITNTVKADNWEILKEKLVREARVGEENEGGLTVDFNLLIPEPESLNIISGGAEWETRDYSIDSVQQRKQRQDMIIKPTLDRVYEEGMSLENFLSASKKAVDTSKFVDVYELNMLNEEEVNKDIDNILKGYYNLRVYGHASWYTWRLENWGTRWNAYNDDVSNWNQTLSFDTAWSCPFEVFEELSKYTPVTVSYADKDTGHNYGIVRFENGERTVILDDTHRSIGESYACRGEDFENLEFDFSDDNYSDEEIEEYFDTDRETFYSKAEKDYNDTMKVLTEVMG